jgi:hypothetical protein
VSTGKNGCYNILAQFFRDATFKNDTLLNCTVAGRKVVILSLACMVNGISAELGFVKDLSALSHHSLSLLDHKKFQLLSFVTYR